MLQSERVLKAAGVPFELHEVGEQVSGGQAMAEALGVEPRLVLRTLVVAVRRGGHEKRALVLQPSDRELDLKSFAKAARAESARLATPSQAESWSGLKRGGIGPFAVPRDRFEFWVAATATGEDRVFVSAGRRGSDLQLDPGDLVRVTGARSFP